MTLAATQPAPTPLLVQNPDGSIEVPTKHGTVVLPEGSYEFVFRRVVIKVTRTVRGEDFKLREGRFLVSNLKAGIFFIYKTLLTLRRGLVHVTHNYGDDTMFNEEGEIHDLVTILAQNPNALFQLSRWKELSPKQKDQLRGAVGALRDLMPERPIDPHKIDVRRYLTKAASLRDSLGRPNPGVASNAVATASKAAIQRLGIVREIKGWIDPRQVAVRKRIADNWDRSHYVYTALAGHQGKLGLIHLAQEVADGVVPHELIAECNKLIGVLERGNDMPFVHANGRSAIDIRGAKSLMERGITREAIKFLQRVAIACEQHLTLLRPYADLLFELSLEVRRRKPDHEALAQLKQRFQDFLDAIPVQRDDQGVAQYDVAGNVIPLHDKTFRGVQVSSKMYDRLEHGLIAWSRADKATTPKDRRKAFNDAYSFISAAERVF